MTMKLKYALIGIALIAVSACGTKDGCDKYGNCASGTKTVLNKFGEQFHQPDQPAPSDIGMAPPPSQPFPQRNSMFDYQGKTSTGEIQDNIKRVADPATNPYNPVPVTKRD